jgi:hypothetical protein
VLKLLELVVQRTDLSAAGDRLIETERPDISSMSWRK